MGSAVKSVERLDWVGQKTIDRDCHCSIIIILGDEGGIAFIGDT